MAKRTAVIDIGSNSARMVIFERTSRFAFHLIHEVKSRVRISENAYENEYNLQEAPLERAYQALHEFLLIIRQYKVRKTLCIATSALRDAPNKQTFISRVHKELGLHIKVIDGNREAYLGAIAAANLLHLDAGLSVDIGGGSTELALYDNKKVLHTYSLDLGTVRLKELFFDNGDIEGAKAYIHKALQTLPSKLKHENIIGIGGTLRALSKMIMDKEEVFFKKLHGFSYPINSAQTYFDEILQSDEKGLRKLGVKKERLDVIQPGLLILTLLIEHIDAKQIISSGVGVREGLYLSDLLRKQHDRFPSNYNPSVQSLLDRFVPDYKQELTSAARRLFDLTSGHLNLEEKYKASFVLAVKLSQIGKRLDFYDAHKHAYYILLNGLSYGYSHEETVLIATLVRFQRKKSPSSLHMNDYENYLPSAVITNNLSFLMGLIDTLYGDCNQTAEIALIMKEESLCIQAKHNYLLTEKLKDYNDNGYLTLTLL
jgi:exopolyphosphatase / guanosine-5'-triphosphate,3'-diphosphate pyrophosphatase